MIRFLRLFAIYRELENLSAMQAESLETEVRAHEETKQLLESTARRAESETARRISAEAIASERREEVERLVQQNHEVHEHMQAIMSDRLKSLDTLNLRLMETRTVEKTPDLAAHQALDKLKANVMQDIHAKDAAMDRLLLTTLHPAFKRGISMNVPASQPPTEEAAA